MTVEVLQTVLKNFRELKQLISELNLKRPYSWDNIAENISLDFILIEDLKSFFDVFDVGQILPDEMRRILDNDEISLQIDAFNLYFRPKPAFVHRH